MKLWHGLFSLLLMVALAGPAPAQSRDESLADIRQELSFLYVEMQRLKQELSTTGSAEGVSSQGTLLQRLDALEGELRRITGKVEELEFRVEKIVADGTNRIGDLEFRLVELEGGDVSTLGETSTLGGEITNPVTIPVTPPDDGNTELAVSEQVDFEAAMTAYDNADYRRSADLFANFTTAYPGGPLTGEAHFWRGEALAELGEWSSAARSYLQSFSSAPNSTFAPKALLRLGVSLANIGQVEEACQTLNEVNLRYPTSDAASEALAEMAGLACSG